MAKAKTIIIWLSVLTALGFGGKYIYSLLQEFQFKVVRYGLPDYKDWILKLPITIKFTNPLPVPVSADKITIDLYLVNQGEKTDVGTVNDQVTLPPGSTEETVVPELDLGSLISSVTDSWEHILSSRRVTILTEVRAVYKGFRLPTQRYEEIVSLT